MRRRAGFRNVTVHPGDATSFARYFGSDEPAAAAHIENVAARPRRANRESVGGFETKFQIVGFFRRIDVEPAIEKKIHPLQIEPAASSGQISAAYFSPFTWQISSP